MEGAKTIAEFLGDGDGPATAGQKEETRGPLLIFPKQQQTNWRIGREGLVVTLTLGTTTLRIPWKEAIPFFHAGMAKAFEAKVLAGEMGKQVEVRRSKR